MAPDSSSQTVEQAPAGPPSAPPPSHEPKGYYAGTYAPQPVPMQHQGGYYHPVAGQYPPIAGQFPPGPGGPQPVPGQVVDEEGRYTMAGQLPELEQKGWRITKLVGHGLGVVLCIVGLGVSLSTLSGWSYSAVVSAPIFGAALIWSAAELITRAIRKPRLHKGIHPGGHVAASLILWLAGALVSGFEGTYAAWYPEYDCDYDYYYGYDYDDDECDDQSGDHALLIATTVLTSLVTILHFALFVGACVDTAKRNARAKQPIMVMAPPYWGHPARGWQHVPAGDVTPRPSGNGVMQPEVPQEPIPLQTRSPRASPGPGSSTGQQPVTEFYGSGRAM